MVRSFRRNGRMPYGTSSSRQRHDYARHPSSNTAIGSFNRGAEPRAGHQPQDRGEVAKASDSRGHEDRAEGASFNGADRGGRSNGRGVQAPHAAATGRLPLCAAAVSTASDTLGLAPLPTAQWDIAPARRRWGQTATAAFQALPHWLLPCRYRRGPDRRREALSLCRN